MLHNLAAFIDDDAAIPAQVVFGQGSVSTTNTVSATLTDPFTNTIAATDTVLKGATGAITSVTNSSVGTTTDKSLGLTGGNTALQSWGVDTIGDPDQLRRLYDLYRFAVDGNNCPHSQLALLLDYPLAYSPTSGGGNNGGAAPGVSIDPHGMIGTNCVLCAETSASAPPKGQPYARVCEGDDGSESVNAVRAAKNAANQVAPGTCAAFPLKASTLHRVELKSISKIASGTGSGASLLKNNANKVCLTINRRLLPKPNDGRWLLWEALPGAKKANSNPAPDHQRDFYLGLYGHYALYVDYNQPDRFSEFVIFVTAAASSTLNPASAGAANGNRQSAPSGVALTSGGGGR